MGANVQHDATGWLAGTAPLPPRARLNYDLDVDVCVIGGGLAGLTAAREVARRGWSVVVLEAARVASGASGCNGGVVLPGFSLPLEAIVERVGAEAARGLWELSQHGIADIRATIGDDDGIVDSRGFLDVGQWPDAAGAAARVALLAGMGTAAEAWPTDRVRAVLRTSHYFGGVFVPSAFAVNPVAYAARLCAAALAAGARIFENTEVTAVDLDGVRKRITTPHARVRAAHVVLAGNVRLAGIVPALDGTLIPVNAHVGVTRPLGERLAHAISFSGAVRTSRLRGEHYRVVDGDRLMWSATGSVLARRSLESAIMTTFPQIGRVRFEAFATAPMGFAVHGMPHIGELSRGVWVAGAFGAQGLNTAAMAGGLIARAIVEGDDTWRRFLPFELVWAGGRTGRVAVAAAAAWRRGSEAAHAAVARQREEFRRSRAEPAPVYEKKKAEEPERRFATARLVAAVRARLKQLALPPPGDALPVLRRMAARMRGGGASGKLPPGKPEATRPEATRLELPRPEATGPEATGPEATGPGAGDTGAAKVE